MKKFLCLVLALILAMSLFVGCSKTEETVKPKTEDTTQKSEPAESGKETPSGEKLSEQTSSVPSASVPETATNKEVATAETAPDVYITSGSKDNAVNISYHLKDCSLMEGLTSHRMDWNSVKDIGFWQCPNCNPPRYEGYQE